MSEIISDLQKFIAEGDIYAWAAVIATAITIAVLLKGILKLITSRLRSFTQRTGSVWDDAGLDIIDDLKLGFIFIWIFYLLSQAMPDRDGLKRVILVAVVIISAIQVAIWGLHLIKTWRDAVLERRIKEHPSSAAALGLLYTAAQAAFLTILVLIGLSNLGINVSALIAGLGVGGIAVALAAQNVLGDLLASLSIVLDKPFVVGDFIVAGQEKGTIEEIGIKTTRLRSLSGEQIILSNKDILESRVQNFKRLWTRRVVQSFGVLYDTPIDQLEKIPGWVKSIITQKEKLTFDRCHLAAYGASSLDFEFVFIVKDPDYNVYMDLQQDVLLDILRKFKSENIGIAFPTQTIHVESLPKSLA